MHTCLLYYDFAGVCLNLSQKYTVSADAGESCHIHLPHHEHVLRSLSQAYNVPVSSTIVRSDAFRYTTCDGTLKETDFLFDDIVA